MTFACQNCGECCGPIPVSTSEWNRIRIAVRQMPVKERVRLEKQERPPLTCPFRDIENARCSVYEVRPLLCQMQGLYEGLPCHYQPEMATKKGYELLTREHGLGLRLAGILGETLGWEDI